MDGGDRTVAPVLHGGGGAAPRARATPHRLAARRRTDALAAPLRLAHEPPRRHRTGHGRSVLEPHRRRLPVGAPRPPHARPPHRRRRASPCTARSPRPAAATAPTSRWSPARSAPSPTTRSSRGPSTRPPRAASTSPSPAADLGDVHPNTVRIVLEGGRRARAPSPAPASAAAWSGSSTSTASGSTYRGSHPALLLRHVDTPGVIARVARVIADDDVNVATLVMRPPQARRRRHDVDRGRPAVDEPASRLPGHLRYVTWLRELPEVMHAETEEEAA